LRTICSKTPSQGNPSSRSDSGLCVNQKNSSNVKKGENKPIIDINKTQKQGGINSSTNTLSPQHENFSSPSFNNRTFLTPSPLGNTKKSFLHGDDDEMSTEDHLEFTSFSRIYNSPVGNSSPNCQKVQPNKFEGNIQPTLRNKKFYF
jgi:hypothetical protein